MILFLLVGAAVWQLMPDTLLVQRTVRRRMLSVREIQALFLHPISKLNLSVLRRNTDASK